MTRRWLAFVLLPCACAVYGSTLLLPATNDAGVDAGTEAGSKCALARWPPRPAANDPSTGDVDVLVALSELHFQMPDAGLTGYDLDGMCTCAGDPESCTPRMGAMPHCDGDGGVDNSGGELLSKFQQIGNIFSDQDLTNALQGGFGGVLLRLQSYNGKANDTQVTFSIYSSNGTELDDAGVHRKPTFDGGDKWSVDRDFLVGGVAPPYIPMFSDPSAYVANGVLVANVDFPLAIGTRTVSRLFIKLKGSVITARVAPVGNTFQLSDGILAARFTTQNFLTSLQGFKDPFNMQDHLCGDSGTYQIIKTQVCRASDVSGDLLSDGKGAPCDAISVAFLFSAAPALFGPVDVAMPAPPPCGSAYSDDCL